MNYQNYKKVELHRHLEGAIRLSTLNELSKGEIPNPADFFQVKQPMKNLKAVIDRFMRTQKLLDSYENIERIAYEACLDAAAENIRVLELRYAPAFINIGHDFNYNEIHQAVLRGIARAESEVQIAVGLIGIIVRSQSLQEAAKSMNFFIEHKDSFIGVDLADEEVGFDCRNFADIFSQARLAGLRITCHSGEENVPAAPSFVKNAIEILGAERIGHGFQIINDKKIMQFVKEEKVVLEVCPTSNYITGNCHDLKSHPLKALHDFGILTTLNSDDPGIFGIDLSNEWQVAHKIIDLSIEDIEQMQETAKAASFISADKIANVWT